MRPFLLVQVCSTFYPMTKAFKKRCGHMLAMALDQVLSPQEFMNQLFCIASLGYVYQMALIHINMMFPTPNEPLKP
jgi:hypothetical protein